MVMKQGTAPPQLPSTAAGMVSALQYLGIEARDNRRAQRIEFRFVGSVPKAAWYANTSLTPAHDGWFESTDAFVARMIERISTSCKTRSQPPKPLRFSTKAIRQYLLSHCFDRAVDPVAEWLHGLPAWDGQPRVELLLVAHLGADNNRLNRFAASGLLVGAVARTMNPGCVHDWIPVLVGRQGIGKSLCGKALLPRETRHDWHSDSVDLGDHQQKQVEQIGSALLVEYSEMAGLERTTGNKLKSHISRTKDRYRRPWHTQSGDVLRHWVGIGTSNPDSGGVIPYDATGHRRYVVVPVSCDCSTPETEPCGGCGKADAMNAYIDGCRDQLWAEAVELYRQGAPHLLPGSMRKQQSQVAEQHQQSDDAMADAIAGLDVSDPTHGNQMRDLMVEAGIIRFDAMPTRAEQLACGNELRRQGWTKKNQKIGGSLRRVWYPPAGGATQEQYPGFSPPEPGWDDA
ncbi:MAG: hypothetical protein OXQ29_26350 [Rhodospirillaceae bacterium]|nr:hypothetical protein [Rhodospirillaceae bacterium]